MAGEAGVGKTRLAREAATAAGTPSSAGGASPEGTPAYGPIVEALRAGLRLRGPGAPSQRWRCSCPSSGRRREIAAPAAVLEALRLGFASMAERGTGDRRAR